MQKKSLRCFSLLALFSLPLGAVSTVEHVLFDHSSFADFSQGEVSNSGYNLYISKDGSIRWIHTFDLNGDGFPDIVIPNDHNHYDTPPAVIYHQNAEGELQSLLPPLYEDMPLFEVLEHYAQVKQEQTFLPVLGGVGVATGDFNGNGFEDIAISSFIHGWNTEVFPIIIYLGSADGYDPQRFVLWDGGFASGIVAADLNMDGYTDIVATGRGPENEVRRNGKLPRNERKKVASPGALSSRILYGSNDLNGEPHTVDLPTLYAIDVGVADLTGSGTKDLVFLEAGEPAYLQFYYSVTDGSFAKSGLNFSVGDAPWEVIRGRKLEVVDVNGDGFADVLVPTKLGLKIFWNDGEGHFSKDAMLLIESPNAYASTAGDFNGDGLIDLAIACFHPESGAKETSMVLLNNGGPIQSWDILLVPTKGATAVVAEDINNDGFDDLIVANSIDGEKLSLDANSIVYWGGEDGLSASRGTQLATSGAVDVTTLSSQANPDWRDILFINRQSGRRNYSGGPTEGGSLPLYIYWGSATRNYSPVNMLKLPPVSPESPIASVDLDEDGYPEIIALTHGRRKVSIYTLRDGSYTLLRRMPLPDRGRAPLIADLNRDGILDLLIVGGNSGHLYHFPDPLNGSLAPQSILTPLPSYSAILGDINNDGYLDLIAAGVNGIYVLPGSAEGFLPDESQSKDLDKFFTKVTVADFNQDGYLDVLAFGLRRNSTDDFRTDSMIFWNRNGVIDFTDFSPVPTLGGAHQGAVADIDGTGGLDIVSSNYHGGDDRHLDLQVFYGDGSGIYNREKGITLPAISAAGALVMDFDQDGYDDILVLNHSESSEIIPGRFRGARHSVGARIYWGSSVGFDPHLYTWIPSYGPHNKVNVDPGSPLDRSPIETYTSPKISVKEFTEGAEIYLQITAETGPSGMLEVEVLGSREKPDRWVTLAFKEERSGQFIYGPFELAKENDGTLRYRIRLNSNFLGTYPIVHRVRAVSLDDSNI